MVKNRKLLIGVITAVILIWLLINLKKPATQTVVPACFSDEDCITGVREGYCDVKYSCISGKCYYQDVNCPELCYGKQDDDNDGKIDCDDEDCFNSVFCPCFIMEFKPCKEGRCYCAEGKSPRWLVPESGEGGCACI